MPGEINLAKGDAIRITANGRDQSGEHKLNNGAIYQVAGFTRNGDITLSNGWTIGADFGHFTHGRVVTSHASQGATVDRVLIAMGHESRPAINAEQFYVSVSRGRHKAAIFTNIAPPLLREAIQRGQSRLSASELMGEPEAPSPRLAQAGAEAEAETADGATTQSAGLDAAVRQESAEHVPAVAHESKTGGASCHPAKGTSV